jgi:hypothetical protein
VESGYLSLTWLQGGQLLYDARVVHAVARLLTLHVTCGLGTLLRLLALPLATGLSTHVMAWLLIRLAALHLAHRLPTLCPASRTVLARARMLRADNLTVWLTTLHLATLGVEVLATC